jgi:hypothetical protein
MIPKPSAMTHIRIMIDDYFFLAKLHEEEAPETCLGLLNVLPIKGKVIQARWSGEAVWLQMDPYGVEVPYENQTSHPGIGQLLYYSGGISEKEILIPYGSACFASKVGMLPGNHFATVIEGVEFLVKMGEQVLWNGAQNIKITRE